MDADRVADVKRTHRNFYDHVTRQLDTSPFGEHAHFLNLGYVPNGDPQWSQVDPPKHCFNRTSVKLVLEVIADCDLADRRVLDVGCGRGGTIRVVSSYFRPRLAVGIDLSRAAVSFGRRMHRFERSRFCQADAERLPFRSGSFDVVINIESSHCYPRIQDFYRDVHRVLAPEGFFLYADILPAVRMCSCHELLSDAGFSFQRERDITDNVIGSCGDVAERRVAAFGELDREVAENFVASPGSAIYHALVSGESVFRILTLQKGLA